MELPEIYQWLDYEPGPAMLNEALHLYGTVEGAGDANNPLILSWAKETGLQSMYSNDAIPWCGLFMAAVAKRSNWTIPQLALRALSWATWGVPVGRPMLGDVLTFKRPGGGHVAMYVGEDHETFHVLGGNQHDSVCFTRIEKGRMFSARRAPYTEQPKNVRPVFLLSAGAVSKNEA